MSRTTRVLHLMMGHERPLGGCEIYRTSMPMHYLGKQSGWETEWIYFESLWNEFHAYGVRAFNALLAYDIVVFPRAIAQGNDALNAMGVLFDMLRAAGVKVVYEVDDDYSNEYRHVTEGGEAMQLLAWADAVTVTTPYLAARMKKYTKQPIYVLPNCIDPEVWRESPIRTERIDDSAVVIGLTGSATHHGDWRVLETVMAGVLNDNPRAHFLVMGYHPSYLADLPQTSYIGGLDYVNYSQIIRACDIILAPVDPADGFNDGKSPIKALEGQAARRYLSDGKPAGAAVIATANPVYSLAVQHNRTGLLTEHTPDAWDTALRRLIADTDFRERLQVDGHKAVYKSRDISNEYVQWARAYRKILHSSPNPVRIPLSMKGS